MAENKQLNDEIKQMDKEFKEQSDPSTINWQFKEQSKLVNDLNEYLKNKVSIDALDRLEDLNKKL